MASAWTQNFYHLVFSTKGRRSLMTPEIEPRLFLYIGGILRDLGCTMLAINGIADHVHILARHPARLSHADLVRHVKCRSSKWGNESFSHASRFGWQEGYGGFTVSKSRVPKLEAYIANQKEHHRREDFKSEFLALLRKHGIEFVASEVFR